LAGKADTGTGRRSVGSRASDIPASASVVLVGAAELYAGGRDFAGLGKHPAGGVGTWEERCMWSGDDFPLEGTGQTS
jgi:hypothetical protein